jgi:hypothetical protein
MSRSVWHKLKETKPERIQLSEVLQGLQPVPRTPIPSRISWFQNSLESDESKVVKPQPEEIPENGHHT